MRALLRRSIYVIVVTPPADFQRAWALPVNLFGNSTPTSALPTAGSQTPRVTEDTSQSETSPLNSVSSSNMN